MNRKSLIPASILFLCTFGLRILYATTFPGLVAHGDSVGYIEIGRSIFLNPSLSAIINPFRNPGYPIFLVLIENIFHSFSIVPYIQFFVASLALSVFFLSLIRIKIPLLIAFWVTFFIGISIHVFGWEKSLMTEGLATSWLLLLVSLTTILIDTPSLPHLILFYVLSILGFFLRPMLTPIPIIILSFLIFHHWVKKIGHPLQLLIILLLYVLVPMLYISGNTVFHGYKSIQQVGDVDVFARILQFHLPVDSGAKSQFYTSIAKHYIYDPHTFRPYDILKYYDPDIYGKQYMFNDLRMFNRIVILSNPLSYALHALSDLPKAIAETSPFFRIDRPNGLFSFTGLFYLLQELSALLTYGHFMVFVLFPLSLLSYIRTKKTLWFLISLLSAIDVCQVLIGVFVVYEEYARLYAVTYPLMVASIILCFSKTPKSLK
ncbi:hypothetical protein HY947_00710 [Candidatus Gottesmanbacteria bacterium]|nr:hypothetical protein [Candidatus Gottesmanbacteria bacterium]